MNIKEILNELRSSNSSNFKKEVLEKHKDDQLLLKVLYYTYNTNFNYYIEKTLEPIEGTNTIESEEELIFNLLDKLRNQELRGNVASISVQNLMNSLTKEDSEILNLIIGRDIKCGISTSTINKVYKNLIPTTPYMGCQGWNPEKIKKHLEEDGKVFSDVKSDGRYCNGILLDEIDLVSRNGKATYLNGLLRDNLKKVRNVLDGDYVLNGELMVKGFNRLQGNSIIARLITINTKSLQGKDKEVQKSKEKLIQEYNFSFEDLENMVYYVVWDVLPHKDYLNGEYQVPRIERLELLERVISEAQVDSVQVQQYKICYSWKDVIEDLKEKLSNGEEGTVIKSINCPWEDGKKQSQYKGKVEFNCELRIVGFNQGRKGTKLENTLGSIQCESEDGLIKVSVGGLIEKKGNGKDFTRDEIWNDQDYFLNGVLEIKCNGLSTNKDGEYNFFFPNYVKFRDDKTTANTLSEIIEIEQSILSVKESSDEDKLLQILNG